MIERIEQRLIFNPLNPKMILPQNSINKFRAYLIKSTYDDTLKNEKRKLILNPSNNDLYYQFKHEVLQANLVLFLEHFDGKYSKDDIYTAIDTALLYELVDFTQYKRAGIILADLLKGHIGNKREFNIVNEVFDMIHVKYKDFLDEKQMEFDTLSDRKKNSFRNRPMLYAESELKKKVSFISYDIITHIPLNNAKVHNYNGLFIRDKLVDIGTYLQEFVLNKVHTFMWSDECFIAQTTSESDAFKIKYLLDEIGYKTKIFDYNGCSDELGVFCAKNDEYMDEALIFVYEDGYSDFVPSKIVNNEVQ